jgi:hypothetical protein
MGSSEWVFDVEGTYDYFSRNHEPLGRRIATVNSIRHPWPAIAGIFETAPS